MSVWSSLEPSPPGTAAGIRGGGEGRVGKRERGGYKRTTEATRPRKVNLFFQNSEGNYTEPVFNAVSPL